MPDYGDKEQYTEALQASDLRAAIHDATARAVDHGVDREWANKWLRKLGAEPVTSSAEYRLNTPITGLLGMTVHASSRAAAAEIFKQWVADLGGKINDCYSRGFNVYNIELTADATEPTFYSGPEDPEDDGELPDKLTLDQLKNAIRDMLIEGVAERSWRYNYARDTAAALNLEPLPTVSRRNVRVPVSGVTNISVLAFTDADDDQLRRTVNAYLRRNASLGVAIVPDEMGDVEVLPEPEENF